MRDATTPHNTDGTTATEAEIAAAVAYYDAALTVGDLDAVDGWFWLHTRVSRFAESGAIRGHDAIAAAAAAGRRPWLGGPASSSTSSC